MERSIRRIRAIAVVFAILVLVVAAAIWVGAVELWVGQQLRAQAAAHLNPTFAFGEIVYTFPRRMTLRGIRLTSPDPESPAESVEILTVDSLALVLSEIPWPRRPFRIQQLDLVAPTLRLVRVTRTGKRDAGRAKGEEEASDRLLGYSDFFKEEPEPAAHPAHPAAKPSDLFQVREVSIQGGHVQYDPRDGSAAIMLIGGIDAKLLLHPSDAGAYRFDFSLGHDPILSIAMSGQLHVVDERLEVAAFSSTLKLGREQDHYLTPAMQKVLAAHDVKGRLALEGSGEFDLGNAASSSLRARLQLRDARYAAGEYELALDHVDSRISLAAKTLKIEELGIDALGGHARIGGTVELDPALTSALHFEGEDMEIGDLLRDAADPQGLPLFSGLLGFSGALRGPLSEIDRRAEGEGRLALRTARLGSLPVLETIDTALDASAEALMKREHTGHDELSLRFSFAGDRARIEKLRMNSRWYGLRGHGDAYFDSRLDLAVDGGPIQRLENELGVVGDLMGEITETLVRARVTGTLGEPKVGIEILRQPLHR